MAGIKIVDDAHVRDWMKKHYGKLSKWRRRWPVLAPLISSCVISGIKFQVQAVAATA